MILNHQLEMVSCFVEYLQLDRLSIWESPLLLIDE